MIGYNLEKGEARVTDIDRQGGNNISVIPEVLYKKERKLEKLNMTSEHTTLTTYKIYHRSLKKQNKNTFQVLLYPNSNY